MKTVRRLYFFLVAFISFEVVLWGMIGLLRTVFSQNSFFPAADVLAQALALILVGVPIFFIHWLWAQRAAAQEVDEQIASLRAIFLYGTLLVTIIPAIQNLLAFITRTLFQVGGLTVSRAFWGGEQTWQDNLIAIVFNLIAAYYFWGILQASWKNLPNRENFLDIRRLYRYIWVLYGLLMVFFGAQQVLRFLFYVPTLVLGEPGREMFANGFALLIIGVPVWVYSWQLAQTATREEEVEQHSMLRLSVFYGISLLTAILTLFWGGFLLDLLFLQVLGAGDSRELFMQQFGSNISVLIPLMVLWAYYGYWRNHEIETYADSTRRAGLNRLFIYLLSLLGLGAVVLSLGLLISLMIDTISQTEVIWGDSFATRLSGGLAVLLVGLPVWLLHWRPIQAESTADGELGDHARQSVIRRAYLYLVIFVCVIGGMVAAGLLVYQVLTGLLSGESINQNDVLNSLQALIIFAVFLAYHFNILRTDGSESSQVLAARLKQFAVLVIEEEGSGFGSLIAESIQRASPLLSVTVQPVEKELPKNINSFQALVLPSGLALNPSEALRSWLKQFNGQRVIAPQETKDWYWAGVVSARPSDAVAQMVRKLAQGEKLKSTHTAPAIQVLVYIFAALFALQILLFLLFLAVALVAG